MEQFTALVAENKEAMQRCMIARDLLFEVTERTHNFTEFFFSAKALMQHEATIFRLAYETEANPMDTLRAITREYDNLTATIMTQVERIDA